MKCEQPVRRPHLDPVLRPCRNSAKFVAPDGVAHVCGHHLRMLERQQGGGVPRLSPLPPVPSLAESVASMVPAPDPRPATQPAHTTNERGLITEPGRFEGEPEFVPHFYDAWLVGGFADVDHDDGSVALNFEDEDYARFPALRGFKSIRLWIDDNGFVYHRLSTEKASDQ